MSTNIPYTQLDPGQVVKQAYDEGKRSIRVDAQISAPDGSSILIDATTDSIKIGNTATGPFLNINSDGSINSNVTGTIVATNPSVGLTGSIAPTSATEIGAINTSGDLTGLLVNNAGELLVSGSSTVTGTVSTNENPLGVFQTSQYSVGLTSIQITPTPLSNRSSLSLRITASTGAFVYIGTSSAVTTSTGYPLANGDTLQMDLSDASQIWAISNMASGQTTYALEMA